MPYKNAIIIGAGPAGLTAAYELLEKTDIRPMIFELDDIVGGISRTINYKGNRMDIGGHRFFSKSDRVMNWWLNVLPLENSSTSADSVMLVRNRTSRIFYERKFYDYPISLKWQTISNLGLLRTFLIGLSYLRSGLFPIKPERSLEDFLINRFGCRLYETFFRDYTEKVWGLPCKEISSSWGAQRIKGLSVGKAILHGLKNIFSSSRSIQQKKTETSLIEQFLYPKYGPGQLWETAAELVKEKGGQIFLRHEVVGLMCSGKKISSVTVKDNQNGETKEISADYVFSTMPVRNLIAGLGDGVPEEVRNVADGLMYRNFITVGLLVRKLKIKNQSDKMTSGSLIPDQWIYIQEPDVKLGRIQIFNNWSPYLVKDPDTVWLGLEYFCNHGDTLWSMSEKEFSSFASDELVKIGFIDRADILDSVVVKVPYTYPGYFGSFSRFDVIRKFTDTIENLFLIGRNGMHRYNNQDHSMLTAMSAVEAIVQGKTSKEDIWNVNAEEDYHEEK